MTYRHLRYCVCYYHGAPILGGVQDSLQLPSATSNCRGDGVQQITGDYRARWEGVRDGDESSTRNSESLSGTGGLW